MHKTNLEICYSPKGKLTDTNVILFKAKDRIENSDMGFDIKRYFRKKIMAGRNMWQMRLKYIKLRETISQCYVKKMFIIYQKN